MKLNFSKAGRTMGDETTPYNVLFDKDCIVSEMIESILKENPTEYGTIELRGKAYEDEWSREFNMSYPSCDYVRGKVTKVNIPDKYMSACVHNVDSCGGWGRMDYFIYIK